MKKISFIVYFPYQWFIYKNIYNQIPSGQREIIVDLSTSYGVQDEEVKESIVLLLERERADFRVFERPDSLNNGYFQDFFSDVEVIVSCWENGCVVSEFTSHIKKVNTTYGVAKELTFLRPTRSIYDVILAYGKRDQKYFSLLTKSIAIGNPRVDNFYRGLADLLTKEKLLDFFPDKKKKIVLYIPTHGDLGSFHGMFGTVKRLSQAYNIVFKPHYYTLREEKEIVEKYRKLKSILVIDDSWDTIEIMALSDVIISDNSSAIFDAMQVDKPIVVCDFLDRHFLDFVHKKLRLIKGGLAGALTYPESLEQEIKNKGFVASIKKPNELVKVLSDIEQIDLKYKDFRRKIVLENFEYIDGHSSEKAAEIIMDVYKTERKHAPGILEHAYRAYNNPLHQWIAESENKEIILGPVGSKIVVWIFCERHQDRDEILGTVYSALNEERVALVCISGAVGENVGGDVSFQKESLGKVRFFDNHVEGFSFIYSQLNTYDNLLFVKANTCIKSLNTVSNYRISCKRDMLFFSENISVDPKDRVKNLFYLLKYEILKLQSVSKDTLLFVSYDMLHASEKSAVFIESKSLLGHASPSSNNLSFEGMMSFFIKIDSLKRQGRDSYGLICDGHALMPNFLTDCTESKGLDIFRKLVAKGPALYSLGIPIGKWPDKKISKFLFKIITGNLEYYQLLRLIVSKIFLVKKTVLLNKISDSLEKMLREIKKG